MKKILKTILLCSICIGSFGGITQTYAFSNNKIDEFLKSDHQLSYEEFVGKLQVMTRQAIQIKDYATLEEIYKWYETTNK